MKESSHLLEARGCVEIKGEKAQQVFVDQAHNSLPLLSLSPCPQNTGPWQGGLARPTPSVDGPIGVPNTLCQLSSESLFLGVEKLNKRRCQSYRRAGRDHCVGHASQNLI